MNGKLWFKHDCNARRDRKHLALRRSFGLQGYGLYWIIIESLCEEESYVLSYSQLTISSLANEMLCDENFVKEYIEAAVDVGLFETDGEIFWSDSLLRRMSALDELRMKRTSAGKKGAEVRWQEQTKESKPRTATPQFDEDSTEMLMAKFMGEQIKSISPNTRIPATALHWQQWAYSFDKIMRIDKRTMEEIHKVMTFTYKDTFWQTIVLSPDGLRKNYEKILAQSSRGKKEQPKPAAHKLLN